MKDIYHLTEKDIYQLTEILARWNKCVLSDFLGGGYSLYSNKTFTEGEFNTLADVVDALANDPSFAIDKQ